MAAVGVWWRGLFGAKEEADAALSLPDRPTQPRGANSFADDNNEFAVAMYGQLRQQVGNVFVSPFSIRIALAMTHAGARDETAAQMREALRISSSDETLHVAVAQVVQHLNAAGGGTHEMAVANSLWGQTGSPLQPGFIDLIARHYSGTLNLVDFRRDAETARIMINQWVEDKTRQKIQDLIPSGGVNADTRLVLVNAVYFKAIWELPFHEAATSDQPFHLEGGRQVRASLMHQHESVGYMQAKGYQAVDLGYRGSDVSMLVLLPDRQDGLRNLEESLSEQMLHHCVAQMDEREVEFFLPRFKITWGPVDVRDELVALGMPLAFIEGKANFSGINGHEPPHVDSLFISNVFHKTFVEVNEEGTEAAAATAVMTVRGRRAPTPPVPLFRADHPFLFAIRDRTSGAILFLGRMMDPTSDS